MEKQVNENLKQDTTINEKNTKGFGVELAGSEAKKITDELSRINDLINHDRVINIGDLENLNSIAKQTKINVGGEIMTVEEVEQIPDLKKNMEIWKEMSEGNFKRTEELTRITPTASKCLEKQSFISLPLLTSAKGLVLSKTANLNGVGLNSLESAEGLVLPERINGFLNLSRLRSAEWLKLPKTIGEGLHLNSLASADGLVLPVTVGGDLNLDHLITAKGITFPQTVEGALYLDNLSSIEGLTMPNIVKWNIFMSSLSLEDKQKLREKYPQYADKI